MTEFLGIPLAGELFLPPAPKAILVIVHGLAEHRGRYKSAVDRCAESGIACVTFDQRGHGESPGPRTDITHFSSFIEDLAKISQSIADKYPELPVFLWGHSLGSLVVLNYVSNVSSSVRGAITTGCPLLAIPRLLAKFSTVGSWLAGLLPTIRVPSRLDPELLSHVENIQEAYRHDALVMQTITLRLGLETSKAIANIPRHANNIQIPWLAIHGAEDRIAPPRGSELLFEALGSQDKKLVILEGLRHEVHNEGPRERELFFSLMTDWIELHSSSENISS